MSNIQCPFCLGTTRCTCTPISDAELARIVTNPMQWLEEEKTKRKIDAKHTYFITFTTKDGVDKQKWIKRIKYEMSRKYIVSFQLCVEHKDTNTHIHAKIKSTKHLKKQHFKTYETAFGWVDIRLVKHDNGIDAYMEKEAEDFATELEEIENLIKK